MERSDMIFLLYPGNFDKYLNNDGASKKWGRSETYDHSRNAATNNQGAPDLGNKFRRIGGGGRGSSKAPKVLKAGNHGVLAVRIAPWKSGRQIRLIIHLANWVTPDDYWDHSFVHATGRDRPTDLEFPEIVSYD